MNIRLKEPFHNIFQGVSYVLPERFLKVTPCIFTLNFLSIILNYCMPLPVSIFLSQTTLYHAHSDELCELLLESVPATHLKDELPGKPVSQLEGSAYQICNLATTVNLSYCEFSNVI